MRKKWLGAFRRRLAGAAFTTHYCSHYMCDVSRKSSAWKHEERESRMKNQLNSTDIATLFLDNDLNVRQFTPQVAKIIKLIPADVGRPITDLASALRYPELAEEVREVLRSLAASEKPIAARDGRSFSVRIMPYRTVDDRIDGVVITFADITASKTLETKLRAKQAGLEKRVADQDAKRDRRGEGK